MSEFEKGTWTTGVIVSFDGQSGNAETIYSALSEDFVIPVDGMSLARQGIDLLPGVVFSARINADGTSIPSVEPRDFTATKQPLSGKQ